MKGWLWLTLVLLPLILGLAWGLGAKSWELLTEREALTAGGLGWLASSAGWLIVIRGMMLSPGAFATAFGLGLVAKALVLGMGGVAVIGLVGVRIEPWVIATAAAFVLASFAQMIPVARVALEAPAPGGRE
jgi:hypothetical protein